MADAAEVVELWRHVSAPRATFRCGECEGELFEVTRFNHDPTTLRLICTECRNFQTNFEIVEAER